LKQKSSQDQHVCAWTSRTSETNIRRSSAQSHKTSLQAKGYLQDCARVALSGRISCFTHQVYKKNGCEISQSNPCIERLRGDRLGSLILAALHIPPLSQSSAASPRAALSRHRIAKAPTAVVAFIFPVRRERGTCCTSESLGRSTQREVDAERLNWK